MALTITRLHPEIGAEVSGVDLGAPLDAPTRHALSLALADHLALVFHGQTLTPDRFLAAASAFGPPMEQHYSQHQSRTAARGHPALRRGDPVGRPAGDETSCGSRVP